MSFVKSSNNLAQKSKWLPIIENISFQSKRSHQKSSPPLVEKQDRKFLEDSQSEDALPVKSDTIQRNIFGATILPQNLSFENSKKLTENQVKLEDIPLVNENEFAEAMFERRLKGKRATPPNEPTEKSKTEEDCGIVVIETNLTRQSKDAKKPIGELLWVADSYEQIPGPNVFRKLMNGLKKYTRQLTILSAFRFIKTYALAAFKTYGPIVRFPEILGGKIVLISRPEHIYAVFEQDQRHPINSMLDSIQRSRLHRTGKNEQTRYHLNESDWESLRKSVKNPMMRGSGQYFEGLEEVSGKFLQRIKTIRSRQDEVPDDFLYEINKWSLECLCYVLFDKTYGFLDCESDFPSKTSQLLYSLTLATKNLCHLETGFQLWRFMNTSTLSSLSSACDVLESNISEFVAQVQLNLIRRRESSDGEFFNNLSLVEGMLLQSRLSPDDIVGNILDTLVIGMNTMSVALGFLLYHLSQNPRVQAELWTEVKEALPEKYSKLEYDQLSSLKFLQACLKESLRLKMPIPVLTRVLSKNVLLSNYQIPKGTFVLMTPQIESMKEENFNEPKEFLPERWLDQEYTHPYTALPMRNYFVNSFERKMAEASICVCAAQIIRHFSIEYLYGNIEATNTVISFPNKPLKFTLVERNEK